MLHRQRAFQAKVAAVLRRHSVVGLTANDGPPRTRGHMVFVVWSVHKEVAPSRHRREPTNAAGEQSTRHNRRNRSSANVRLSLLKPQIGVSVGPRSRKTRLCLNGGEAVSVEPAFPPASGSKPRVINRDGVLFASTSHQRQRTVGEHLRDCPVLIDLIRIPITMLGRMDLLSTRTGIRAGLADSIDDRVSRLDRKSVV